MGTVRIVASSCGPPAGIDTAVLALRIPNVDTGASSVASELIDGAPSPDLLLLLRARLTNPTASRCGFLCCDCDGLLAVAAAAGAGQDPHFRHPPFRSGIYSSPRARAHCVQLQKSQQLGHVNEVANSMNVKSGYLTQKKPSIQHSSWRERNEIVAYRFSMQRLQYNLRHCTPVDFLMVVQRIFGRVVLRRQ